MIDYVAAAVLVVCLISILSKHVPTGVLGSAGLAMIGVSAMVAIDDGSFANVDRLDGIVLSFLIGFLAIVAHLVWMVYRGSTGKATRRRRTTDWQSFDGQDTRPMERV